MTVTTNYLVTGNGITGSTANAVQSLVSDDGIAAPTTNCAAAVGAAGVLTGAYYYTQTFVTALGETAPWPGTTTVVNPSSQQVNLTSIPVGPAGVIARRIYRTPAVSGVVDPKDYRFVAEISDNTTTTYTDNLADGSLGDPVDWNATNRGQFRDASGARFAAFSDQSTGIGQGAFNGNTGYASTAIGFAALKVNTTGRRNTAIGTYALTSLTTSYESTGIGVHAGQSVTTGAQNTFVGYSAGFYCSTAANNVAIGRGAFYATVSGTGQGNTAIGDQALGSINTADNCIAIGNKAGKYANASRQIFIDPLERSNIAGCQDNGWLYGEANTTVGSQRARFNAYVRIGPAAVTVSGLPAATGLAGYRGFVTDANATTFASIVAGGGANGVPVYCDGTNWRIG